MMSRIERRCIDKGMKMTEQRRVIARVLSEAEDHPNVEEVYRRATVIDPRISIATVYRTVRLFEENDILERHDFRDGRARYEAVTELRHDHLIDLETGKVVEFRNEQIEQLQREIARALGYRLTGHRLELYGVPLASQSATGRPAVSPGGPMEDADDDDADDDVDDDAEDTDAEPDRDAVGDDRDER